MPESKVPAIGPGRFATPPTSGFSGTVCRGGAVTVPAVSMGPRSAFPIGCGAHALLHSGALDSGAPLRSIWPRAPIPGHRLVVPAVPGVGACAIALPYRGLLRSRFPFLVVAVRRAESRFASPLRPPRFCFFRERSVGKF